MNLKCPNVVTGTDLLGIDVGFSKVQKSTGIALLHENKLILYRADATWEDRKRELPPTFHPSAIAIDGPLLPAGVDPRFVRPCEQLFSRGLFCKRCKPGLSHFGTGFQLRQAAQTTHAQLTKHFTQIEYVLGDRLAEAFPNLFLGVLVSEEQYAAIPKLRRGQKFDWLYDCAVKKLWGLTDFITIDQVVYERAEKEDDHELRAALICLLTAALALNKKATLAGSENGGWFWLPPISMWEPWAVEAVGTNLNEQLQPASSE